MKIKPKLVTVSVVLTSLFVLIVSFLAFKNKMDGDLQFHIQKNISGNAAQTSALITDKLRERSVALTSLSAFIGQHGNFNDETTLGAMCAATKNGQFVQIAISDLSGDSLTGTGLKSNFAGYDFFKKSLDGEWCLITVVPTNVMLPQSNDMFCFSGLLSLGTAFAFILFGVYAILLLRRKNIDIKKRSRELNALTANIPGCVQRCKYDSNLTIVYCSDGFLKLTGYSAEEINRLFSNGFINMIYEPDREETKNSMDTQLQSGSVIDIQYRLRKKDGSLVWILSKGQLMAESGNEPEIYSLLTDITRQREMIQELEISNERYQIVLEQSDSMIFEYDILKGIVIRNTVSPYMLNCNRIIKNFPESVLCSNVIHPDDTDLFRSVFEQVKGGAHSAEGECRFKEGKGPYLWCNIKVTTIFNRDGLPVRAIGRISDITCQKEATQKLMQKAQLDALTGLLNKAATRTAIEQSLAGNELCALYIIDIDHFKEINDNLGHMFGDAVLSGIGYKLKKLFRASDIVGRIGGDEFMVLLKNICDLSLVEEKAEAIAQNLKQEFGKGLKHYSISGSIGVALYPKDGRTFTELYQKADVALYEAKRAGRNQYVIFDSNMEAFQDIKICPELHNILTPTLKDTALMHQDDIFSFLFDMLYHAKDFDNTMGLVLKIVGERFHLNRIYIYEDLPDSTGAANTCLWYADSPDPYREHLQNISYSGTGSLLNLFNEDGTFLCSDISKLPPPLRNSLNMQSIGSILHIAILEHGAFKGFIGFDKCGENLIWTAEEIDALSLIAKIIGIFILKKRPCP